MRTSVGLVVAVGVRVGNMQIFILQVKNKNAAATICAKQHRQPNSLSNCNPSCKSFKTDNEDDDADDDDDDNGNGNGDRDDEYSN